MSFSKKLMKCAYTGLLLCFTAWAQAAFVSFDVPGTVLTGGSVVSGSETAAVPFSISQAGTYQVSVVDFEFMAQFETLGFAVTFDGNLVGVDFVDGGFNFDADAGEALFHYSAITDAIGVGAFGVQIAGVAPVPIPNSAVLFIFALFVISAMARGNSRGRAVSPNLSVASH